MDAIPVILGALVVVSAIGSMSFRNLVHCALSLAVALAGLAALYLQLGAAFVGWAQILVYIGAVAILIMFAILLTRSGETPREPAMSRSWAAGIGIALLVCFAVSAAILRSPSKLGERMPKEGPGTKRIGQELMTNYIMPLEAAGLLLTAATIGAVVIAMRDRDGKSPKQLR